MRQAKDILARKKARCAVCYREYQYYPAWPYGDVCSSDCAFKDTRLRQDHGPHIAKKERLPTKASIIDVGGYDE